MDNRHSKIAAEGLRYTVFLLLCHIISSCNSIGIKDEQHFSDIISVIVSENGEKYIKNTYSLFSSPALDTIPEKICGYASFTIDYENQPSGTPPYVVNLVSWNTLDVATFRYMSGSIVDSYKDTLLSISSILNLDRFMFLSVNQRFPDDYIYSYELLCCKDSIDKNNIMTMYLKSKLDSQGVDTIPVSNNFVIAFDIFPLLADQIEEGNDSLIQFNVKYSYKTDSEGDPIYSSYKNNPIKLQIADIIKKIKYKQ